jgi:phosphatidylinositol alpha-1,6-mannosyltransferase
MWQLYSRLPCADFLLVANQSIGCEEFDQSQELSIQRLPLDFDSWGAIGWRSSAAYVGIYRRLRKLVCEHSIENVHAACCLPEGFLAWMLKRRMGISYLVYVHGEELNVARTSRELGWMTQRVLRNADAVLTNSQNTRNLLIQQWGQSGDRLRVVHPGVDTLRFQPAAENSATRHCLGWGDRRVLLTVGRLQKRKGHDQMVRALAEIRSRVPDVLYAIVGVGEESEHLKGLTSSLGLQNHVIMHGELSEDELITAYQQCDLFVLPNREVDGDIEGFGIVLLEAQACGKPVIAGASGGTADAIHLPETGRIIDCTGRVELTTTVSSLLVDRNQLRQMGSAARQWVVDQFDWKVACPIATAAFSLPKSASGLAAAIS